MKLLQELQLLKEEHKYWGSTPESKEQRELFSKLVKSSGKSDTVEGELLRAANKIYYDYFNNGFGNNWSGAFNFLKKYSTARISHELDILKDFSTGKMPHLSQDKEVEHALDSLMDKIVHEIKHAGDELTPHSVDMNSLMQASYRGDDGDDEYDTDDQYHH